MEGASRRVGDSRICAATSPAAGFTDVTEGTAATDYRQRQRRHWYVILKEVLDEDAD